MREESFGFLKSILETPSVSGFEQPVGRLIRKRMRLGPNINPVLGRLLVEAAATKEIPHQIGDAPKATGTDANAMQISRAGMATGLVALPNRYMHTPVEVCALADLEDAARLIAEVAGRIDEGLASFPYERRAQDC